MTKKTSFTTLQLTAPTIILKQGLYKPVLLIITIFSRRKIYARFGLDRKVSFVEKEGY